MSDSPENTHTNCIKCQRTMTTAKLPEGVVALNICIICRDGSGEDMLANQAEDPRLVAALNLIQSESDDQVKLMYLVSVFNQGFTEGRRFEQVMQEERDKF